MLQYSISNQRVNVNSTAPFISYVGPAVLFIKCLDTYYMPKSHHEEIIKILSNKSVNYLFPILSQEV
jgi:hypothetical protein